MYLPNGGVVQNYGAIQPILFLEVSLTENWLIFVTRGGKTWPSWQLVGAILGVDILATIFCLFGWMSGNLAEEMSNPATHFHQRPDGWVDVVTVVVIWAYSIGVTIVIAIVYYLMNQIPYLDNLGRKTRSKKDTDVENILAHVAKLALEHETDATGKSRFVLTSRAGIEAEDE